MTEQQQKSQVEPLQPISEDSPQSPRIMSSKTSSDNQNRQKFLTSKETTVEELGPDFSSLKIDAKLNDAVQEIAFFNKESNNQTQQLNAIQLYSIRSGADDDRNSKSFEDDFNDPEVAEFVSDCDSNDLKLQMASDNASETVDPNGFEEGIDEHNDDDERIASYRSRSQQSRSRSRSRPSQSSGSRGSPQLSIDDVSLSGEEEQDKVSINSYKGFDQPSPLSKRRSSRASSAENLQQKEQIQEKQDTSKAERIHQDSNGEKQIAPHESKQQVQLQTLQKSTNESTTCSSNTMKGSKNVTSQVPFPPMVPPSTATALNQQDPNSNLQTFQNENNKTESIPLHTKAKPQIEEERDNLDDTQLSKSLLPKPQPKLDKENYMNNHFKRFLVQVENREIQQHTHEFTGSQTREETAEREGLSEAGSEKSSNAEEVERDNEDPTAPITEKFDPKELRQSYDGWKLYKKRHINFAPVRRYQIMVDQDYKKNKVTVCAHLQNIYNSHIVRNGRPQHNVDNFFNLEKLLSKFAQDVPSSAITKEEKLATKSLNRQQTLPNIENNNDYKSSKDKKELDFLNNNNILLTKTLSTSHIPDNVRAKNSKRAYANFDKDLSCKMFGYRINFSKREMKITPSEPQDSQTHKPLAKFITDITQLLSRDYVQIPKYHTKQRILIPVRDSESEEENAAESPKSPKSPSKENSDGEDGEVDFPEMSPEQLEGTDKELTKKILSKSQKRGDLVTIRLRNGDRQTYRKRGRNLMWKCGPIERQGSALNGRRTLQKGKTSDSIYQSSPNRTNSYSISPKKPGKDQGKEPTTVMQGIKILNMVRYLNPRQGSNFQNNNNKNTNLNKMGSSDVNHSSQYGGLGGHHYRRQNSANKTGTFSNNYERKQSAKGDRKMRVSGDPTFFENDDREVSQITQQNRDRSNQSTVYLMDSNATNTKQERVMEQQNNQKLINPGILPKDPSLMKPGESQTLVIELSEEQTRLLENGQLTANGVPIPKDLNKLTYEQIIALLNSLSLPVEVSKQNQNPHQQQSNAQTNMTSRQQKMANQSKYSQSFNATKTNLMNHHLNNNSHSHSEQKKQNQFAQDHGGVLNSASFINIKKTGIYTNNQQHASVGKGRGGRMLQRPDSNKRSRQQRPASFYEDDMKMSISNTRSGNQSCISKNKGGSSTQQNVKGAMGESERTMIQNVNRQQQQLLNAQQYLQASLNYEQARKQEDPKKITQAQPIQKNVQGHVQQQVMGQQRVTGPVSAIQRCQQNGSGQPNFIQTTNQSKPVVPFMINGYPKKADNKTYGEIISNGAAAAFGTNKNQNQGEQNKQSLSRLGSKRRLNQNLKKHSNSDAQQASHRSIPNNVTQNSTARGQNGHTKSAQNKTNQQQLVQLSSYSYNNEQGNQKNSMSGRFDDRNRSQPGNQHYQDSSAKSTPFANTFHQGQNSKTSMNSHLKSSEAQSNPQPLTSLNRYYQSLGQGNNNSQINNAAGSRHQAQSTKNKSSKKTISLDESKIDQQQSPGGGSVIVKHRSITGQKPSNTQHTSDRMSNEQKMTKPAGPIVQPQNHASHNTGRQVQGSLKSITGPCTQYYNKMTEQETQLTAYRMRISQTHMNSMNNQSSTQKRKIESALAQSAIQSMGGKANPQAQTNANFQVARENQANYMKGFVPIEQKHNSEIKLNSGGGSAPPQSNNYMLRSGEFKRGAGMKQAIPASNTVAGLNGNNANSLMMRSANNTYQNHQNDYTVKNPVQQKNQGQKLANIGGGAYGNSLTEIQTQSSKAYTGQQSISTTFNDSGTNSSKQNNASFMSKQFSKAAQNPCMNTQSKHVQQMVQTHAGAGGSNLMTGFRGSQNGSTALHNRQGAGDFHPEVQQR